MLNATTLLAATPAVASQVSFMEILPLAVSTCSRQVDLLLKFKGTIGPRSEVFLALLDQGYVSCSLPSFFHMECLIE